MGGGNRQPTTRERPKESADNRPARDLEIIRPAYNEAGRLPATLEAVQVEARPIWGLTLPSWSWTTGSVDRTMSCALERPGRRLAYYYCVLGCDEQGKGAARVAGAC